MILWEMLTEEIPYKGISEAQIQGLLGYSEESHLPKPPEGSDEFIISIMNKCLQRDPTERPTFIEIQRMIKEERKNRPYVKDVWNILWSQWPFFVVYKPHRNKKLINNLL